MHTQKKLVSTRKLVLNTFPAAFKRKQSVPKIKQHINIIHFRCQFCNTKKFFASVKS